MSALEMSVLVGGMRVLNANFEHTAHGVFTDRPEALSNDCFVNLLDMDTIWKPSMDEAEIFAGRDRHSGEVEWTAINSMAGRDCIDFPPWLIKLGARNAGSHFGPIKD